MEKIISFLKWFKEWSFNTYMTDEEFSARMMKEYYEKKVQ
jgi:hypothetical protein